MPYVVLVADPGTVPAGFDKFVAESDGDDGTGQALWVVVHGDDPTLVAWYTGEAISPYSHGAGSWSPSELTRMVSGISLATMRSQSAAFNSALDAAAPSIRQGLKDQLSSLMALLPSDPRA